ncbi:membrane-bound O-acyltransferase family protein [Nostocales cyanobacterium HT-58-2]|nr:membrane-bound O-acyltransferase family protein [Nostocales cyanobacterium HT-58-2]
MLFNSSEFIFLFLPITLFVFLLLGRGGYYKVAIAWLTSVSLFFYGWWDVSYLTLLVISILFNYFVGVILSNRQIIIFKPKFWLIFGILVNLCLLGYFKYANFTLTSINSVFKTSFHLPTIILPLAISFFTFNQIAYLVDAYRGEAQEHNLLKYCLFITFFPHLIAGPVVHHKEMIPQLDQKWLYRLNSEDLAVGVTIFSLGLFKKVIFADSIATYANPVFHAATQGAQLTLFQAWAGAIAYSLQLYFDFSGYSDMAIGAARMFGIKFPLNFNSPYKAVNIIDFWRRWHMTLSRFLKDYLYIPLGGNRKGPRRRYLNLMITMLLGGLWHGAGWNFIIWGGLHGVYLVINHQWHSFRKALGHDLKKSSLWSRALACLLTFLAVVIAWVFFRANNMNAALAIIKSMSGVAEVSHINSFPTQIPLMRDWMQQTDPVIHATRLSIVIQIILLLLIVWTTPNTQEWMRKHNPAIDYQESYSSSNFNISIWHKLQWRPNLIFSIITSILIFISIKTFLSAPESEFLYFNF